MKHTSLRCKTQCQVFPIPVWIKAASGLWLMEPTRKRKKAARGGQGWLVSALAASGGAWCAAAEKSREEKGGSAASSGCHRLPTSPFARSDLSAPSPLPFGVPIGGPNKSALRTKQVSTAFFLEILQIYFCSLILFIALLKHLSWEKGECQRKFLSRFPVHNRRRRMEMQLRENTSNKW